MADFTFWFIAILTVASAIMVVMSKSLLYSAYSLLVTFLGVTALYVFLWADFLAVVQVVVYVGGILVLIIFGIMLTNKISSVNISHTSVQKRMGAIVFATDVRMAAREQVESLGGKFLTVEGSENLETESGYAKETSEAFKKKQENLLSETLKKIDIVICTALIPGKKAPLIIKENMLKNLKAGAIIYDLAVAQGGNVVFSEIDKIVDKNGVKIMGERNILNKLPISASNLYSKNLFNFVLNLYDKKNKKININLGDEIIKKTLID